MPSDRTPSQAEIQAAAQALRELDPVRLYGTVAEVHARAALSAAATARPDPEPCNQCGRAQDEFENIESRAHHWEGIARELHKALTRVKYVTESTLKDKTQSQRCWQLSHDALQAFERASLLAGRAETCNGGNS